MNLSDAIGQKLLLAFAGKDKPSPEIVDALRELHPAGLTLFRALNVDHPAQVRQLTQSLQEAAKEAGLPLLLIGVDQEGGQLMAIGKGTTQLPGNLALGATGSPELARQAGEVLGQELAAMGINVNYAPCCDVNSNPHNPVVGTRSFGEDPHMAAQLASAMIAGIQVSGVAATAKHFPGHGDTSSDSHFAVASLMHTLERLRQVEFPPFAAAIGSDVKLIMVGHLSLPAVEGQGGLPATLSPAVMKGLLREELNFEGVIVTDAMNMGAIPQGEGLGEAAVRAVQSGADLLLLGANLLDQRNVYTSLLQAAEAGQLDAVEIATSNERIQGLKRWIASRGTQPDLSVVGCAAHQAIAAEIAERSITLVRDRANLLPLRLQNGQRLAVIMPQPHDLTPADTSSYVTPKLADALRAYSTDVDEFIIPHSPSEGDIAELIQGLRGYSLAVVGTLNAFTQPGQAELVRAVLQSSLPCVVAALRMSYDLTAFPEAPTYVCCYSILEPSMEALAKALWGSSAFPGRLPVSIPNLYPAGHGQTNL